MFEYWGQLLRQPGQKNSINLELCSKHWIFPKKSYYRDRLKLAMCVGYPVDLSYAIFLAWNRQRGPKNLPRRLGNPWCKKCGAHFKKFG